MHRVHSGRHVILVGIGHPQSHDGDDGYPDGDSIGHRLVITQPVGVPSPEVDDVADVLVGDETVECRA